MNLGIALLNTGHLAEAEDALEDADAHGARAENLYARITALAHLGRAQALQGRVTEAAAVLSRAVELAGRSPTRSAAQIELAAVRREQDRLDEAERRVDDALVAAEQLGNPELALRGWLLGARLHAARGDAAAAEAALAEAHGRMREATVSVRLRSVAAACHVEVALASGHLATARRRAKDVIDHEVPSSIASSALVPARLLLAAGDRQQATEVARGQLRRALDAGWTWEALRAHAVLALACPTPVGLRHLRKAIALVRATRFVRTLADLGAAIAEVLEQLPLSTPEDEAIARRIGRAVRPSLVRPVLTERQLEVLRCVADLRSNRQVAAVLHVSENTVKFHLKQIYAELGVTGRGAAVRRARALGLLVS